MSNLIVLFLVTIAYSVVQSQTDYCKLSCNGEINIGCKRKDVNCKAGPKCNGNYELITLKKEDKQLILDLHNHYRNQVATGQVNRGNQPSSSNMKALSYNSELGDLAQCYANNCQFYKDKQCSRTESYSNVGQNTLTMDLVQGEERSYQNFLKRSIKSWFTDYIHFNSSSVSNYQKSDELFTADAYTQLAWAETQEVGCGIIESSYFGSVTYYAVCNYGPGGNVVGAPVYKTGKPASACPSGFPVNSKYPGLCGKVKIN